MGLLRVLSISFTPSFGCSGREQGYSSHKRKRRWLDFKKQSVLYIKGRMPVMFWQSYLPWCIASRHAILYSIHSFSSCVRLHAILSTKFRQFILVWTKPPWITHTTGYRKRRKRVNGRMNGNWQESRRTATKDLQDYGDDNDLNPLRVESPRLRFVAHSFGHEAHSEVFFHYSPLVSHVGLGCRF